MQEHPNKLVEIVGCLTDSCVATTAHFFLENNAYVMINPELTIPGNPNLPSYWNGRIILRSLLSKQAKRRCLIYDKKFIFYNKYLELVK